MTILRQTELLTQIVGKMQKAAGFDHQEMACRFNYYADDSWSVNSRFWFVRAGVVHQVGLSDPTGGVYLAVHELHESIRAQTGGDWKTWSLLSIQAVGDKPISAIRRVDRWVERDKTSICAKVEHPFRVNKG